MGKRRYLKDRIHKDHLIITIIQDTKISESILKELLQKMKLQYELMAQDSNGILGGLAILWNPKEVIFDEWVSLPRILSGNFIHIGSRHWTMLMGVYGPHIRREKRGFLDNLGKIQ